MSKRPFSKTRFLLGFSDSGFPTEELRAGRSRRRRRHSSLNGAMSGREGVFDEPLIETLDEPPIGNAACPQTSPIPDAVVLGGIPLEDETPAPGERVGTGTPSASSTHDRTVLHEDRTPFLNSNEQLSSASGSSSSPRDTERFHNLLSQRRTFAYQWAIASPLRKVGLAFQLALVIIVAAALGVRFGIEGVDERLVLLSWFVFITLNTLNTYYILPWLRRRYTTLTIVHWRLSGGDAREVSYQPTSCAVNIFGCSPMWRHFTRMLEHETDPTLIRVYTRARSHDLSAADTNYIATYSSSCALVCGALYYAIYGRGRVWGILYFVYMLVFLDFYYIVLILNLLVRNRRYRGGYSQAGLDPF